MPRRQFRSAILGLLIGLLLASSVAMVSAARTLDIGPKIGDILVFRTARGMPSDWEFAVDHVAARRLHAEPAVMAADGGSLVVEQRFNDPHIYHVHWAGGRTPATAPRTAAAAPTWWCTARICSCCPTRSAVPASSTSVLRLLSR